MWATARCMPPPCRKNHTVLQGDGKNWLFFFCAYRPSCAKNALPVGKFFTSAAGGVVFQFYLAATVLQLHGLLEYLDVVEA